MQGDIVYRTEDIPPEEILNYLVETEADRHLIDALKGRSPVVLKGSRGVGKSFLMRAAEAEIRRDFSEVRILPVYVTFAQASLIRQDTPDRFLMWMMAKLCTSILRAASTFGLTLPGGSAITAIQGSSAIGNYAGMQKVESIFETSWMQEKQQELPVSVPDPEVLRDAVEDLCRYTGIKRVVVFVDEAAHVFIPEQQRQFFTLMRDLRSPYLTMKAAVYPGATSYGHAFQPTHDASLLSVDRNVTDSGYAAAMRSIVYKQDDSLKRQIEPNGDVFDTLSYAATGNPRILLKTLLMRAPFNRRNAQETIREYYREEIWKEHSNLSERYPGHSALIDWGRGFIEDSVLPALYARNSGRSSQTSSYFWIHRDAPQAVREALRLLCYSGIVQEGDAGIRATRGEIGTRYMVNLGCLFAQDAEPVKFGQHVRQNLYLKRMVEYGANHGAYRPIDKFALDAIDSVGNQALEAQLDRSIDYLDVTDFQRSKLKDDLGLRTIGEVLKSDEQVFKQAYYVGTKRARQMRNAAVTAVLEYLSG
ncbi:hypothetical protein OG350_24905 [Streptomyces achromogenes]|uniref:Orc1-like AAA ATPase domain-containing protein n=1 Tax=Streptomyces achromogenes TaxID=67255 RepID=A0ABZ1KRY4_STRAH